MGGNKGRAITVRATKYDGSNPRNWCAQLLRQQDSLLVLDAEFEHEVQHELLGTINRGTQSLEYYWLDRWYNVFRFAEASGKLRNYYCNVSVPPVFDGQLLSYIDLDIDILVEPDFSYEILDTEHFEQNANRFGYPAGVREEALHAVDKLIVLVETRSFPFNQ